MICQKLNYFTNRTYSQPVDWNLVAQMESDPAGAVSCDNVSDSAVLGLLNWQADGMMQRLQCCVVKRDDYVGFDRQVKYHIESRYKKSTWPRYYDFFDSFTVRVGKNSNYYVYGTLNAHVDVISFSMFTFHPHERSAKNGIASWVLHDRRLEGIDEFISSTNRLLRIMGHLAFGYPTHLDCSASGGSDARAYAEMLVLASGR
jgi:hypothetical protein